MNKKKTYNINNLIFYIKKLREENLTIGFTNGCFDLLHQGHLSLLSQAKQKCDFLIVGLNSDSSVRNLKGYDRPIDNEKIRINKLSAIKDVDALIIFGEETPLKVINKLLPNILFKGSDYKNKEVVGSVSVIENGGKVEFIEILEGFSTTNIIKNSSI